jgi:hypothetical protein
MFFAIFHYVPEAHVMNQDVVDDLPEVLKFDKLLPTSI